jgi:hypothetical protein
MLSIGRSRKHSGRDHLAGEDQLVHTGEGENVGEDGASLMGSMASIDSLIANAWHHRALGATMNLIPVKPDFLHPTAWNQWLWDENPMEEADAAIMLNSTHLLGLLIARFRAAFQDRFHESSDTVEILLTKGWIPRSTDARTCQTRQAALSSSSSPSFNHRSSAQPVSSPDGTEEMNARKRLCVVHGVPVREMTLRQLQSSIHNIQHEWVALKVPETMHPQIWGTVDALFHR